MTVIEGLADIVIAANLDTFLAIFGRRIGGQRNDRVGISCFPQLPSCFVAVHDRHLDVHQNDIEGTASLLCCQGKIDGNLSIFCHRNFGTRLPQNVDNKLLVVGTILGQQNTTIQLTPTA